MPVNYNYKRITVILPKGKGMSVIKSLKEDKQIVTANLNYARGVGRMTPLRFRGVGEQSEKEIVSVIVSADRCDEVFEYIYDVAEIDNPHAGIIYVTALKMANEFELPEDLAEEK